MSHELGTGAGQKVMLLFAIAGVGLLLLSQAAYMDVFSYPVMSRSTANGITYVNITYVNPLYSLFLVLLIGGMSTLMYGAWESRRLLALHKRDFGIAFVTAAALTLLTLLDEAHLFTNGPNDYYNYGIPLPWLTHILIDIPYSHSFWLVTPWITYDVFFWAVIAYLGIWMGYRIRGLPRYSSIP